MSIVICSAVSARRARRETSVTTPLTETDVASSIGIHPQRSRFVEAGRRDQIVKASTPLVAHGRSETDGGRSTGDRVGDDPLFAADR